MPPEPVALSFLAIPGVGEFPVPRGTGTKEPDGHGKYRWRFQGAPVEPSMLHALEGAGGVPSGAESTRAWDGTLLTDRPTPVITGSAMEPDAGRACEITITGADHRHYQDPDTGVLRFRYVVSLTLREA
jgi:hypothetical protein